MQWWNQQSNLKKLLIAIAFIGLAAGFGTTSKALVGGVFFFIVFLLIALMIPNKKKTSNGYKEIEPFLKPYQSSQDKISSFLLSILAVIVIGVSVFYLFRELLQENYLVAVICAFTFFAALSSLAYLHPRLYNQFFVRKKLVPLKKPIRIEELYKALSDIRTPFGTPLLEYDGGKKVIVYRIIDLNWIVFISIKNEAIEIEAKYLNLDDINNLEASLVYKFTQDLADLLCFYENTDEMPDKHQTVEIFSNMFPDKM